MDLENAISNIETTNGVKLNNVCYKPLAPDNQNCTIFSPTGYYQNDKNQIDRTSGNDNYLDHFKFCSVNPASPKDSTQLHSSCLGAYGGPVDSSLVLGNFGNNRNYSSVDTAVLTFVISNHYNLEENWKALEWESAFIHFMREYKERKKDSYKIAFNTERSIEDELSRESHGEVSTVLISYLIMFLYISLSLGDSNTFTKRFLIDSKITLGLAGVCIVLFSVSSAIGIFGFLGIPATLITIEVIPFLVLAVGVDNIFILVQTWQREHHDRHDGGESENVQKEMSKLLGKVGPSMLLSTASESVCFFLGGALSDMPAVKAFAFYAAVALLIDFLLQITCFLALLSLDVRREKKGRLDVFCWWVSNSF